MKSFKILLAISFALTIFIPTLTSTAATPAPQIVDDRPLSGSGAPKWPMVAVGGGRTNVAWSETAKAQYATGSEEGPDLNTSTRGSIGDNSTYFNAAVAVAQDGTVHYSWISGGSTIYHVSKSVQGIWSPVHQIPGGHNFANTLTMGVRGNNEVFIAWRHQGPSSAGYIGFAYSGDAGVNWPAVGDVPAPKGAYAGRPDISAGRANLPVFLTWTGVDGNVYLGEWGAGNFNTSCLTCSLADRKDFFGPSVSTATDGRPFVAWRSVSQGVFYASRQTNGTWGYSRVFPYPEVSSVSIAVDTRDNVHLTWISKANNRVDTFYAVQKPGQFFSNPIVVSGDNGAFKANVHIDVSLKSGYGMAHIVYESFGGGQLTRYARVRVQGIGCDVSAASSSGSEGFTSIQAVYSNAVYAPMIVNGSIPVPTPTRVPPTPTPTPLPSC